MRFSKRRSKHSLNSIHKSCKLQLNRFKCDGLGKRHKNTYSPICQTLFPSLPDEHALHKDNFATGNAFSPPRPRILWCMLRIRSAASGTNENAGNGELSKFIADIARCDGNFFLSFFLSLSQFNSRIQIADPQND